jgi:uncharacterized surface protein with fasciclin (FAS1) repeats
MNTIRWISVLSLSAGLVACGSDDDASPSPTTSDPGSMPMDSGTEDPTNMGSDALDIVDTAAAAGGFESLLAAATAAGLVDTLKGDGPLTVFAPTDEAFAALLDGLGVTLDDLTADQIATILTYHVISGRVTAEDVVSLTVAQTVQGSDVRVRVEDGGVVLSGGAGDVNVIATDISATNGVIHVIDGVLLPPSDIPTTATDAGFESLVAAVAKAELVDTLAGEGPFTVFAPTDEAFAAALDSLGVTLDDLTKDDLTPILTYHVVPGKLYSEDVVAVSSATTVQGGDVSVEVVDGGVVLNGSVNVVATDVLADNGVIHVIDGVLLP